jgi:hypothetical protein
MIKGLFLSVQPAPPSTLEADYNGIFAPEKIIDTISGYVTLLVNDEMAA